MASPRTSLPCASRPVPLSLAASAVPGSNDVEHQYAGQFGPRTLYSPIAERTPLRRPNNRDTTRLTVSTGTAKPMPALEPDEL